jgi:hypothetical protein
VRLGHQHGCWSVEDREVRSAAARDEDTFQWWEWSNWKGGVRILAPYR